MTHSADEHISLSLRYFAILREQSGKGDEQIRTTTRTPRTLYEELAGRYPFTLPVDRVRVAVNDAFESMDVVLKNGDNVVFVPPVAGG